MTVIQYVSTVMQTLCLSFQVSFTVLAHISKEHRTFYKNVMGHLPTEINF